MKERFRQPDCAVLRWLTYPGKGVSPGIGNLLLSELFSSNRSHIAGVTNGVMIDGLALHLGSGIVFAVLLGLEAILAALKYIVVSRIHRAASIGRQRPTDVYFLVAALWCALQGAMAFAAVRTANPVLCILAATTTLGIAGPICARNYAVPRFAMALILLSVAPFGVGAAIYADKFAWVVLLQVPLFIVAADEVIRRFQTMAITVLQAEQDNHEKARRDSLTGLLNREGLAEALDADDATGKPLTLFYLDLDRFKPINDNFGHLAGDRILQDVASRLDAVVGTQGIVARIGGDEFAIVARAMSPQEAGNLACRIIRGVTETPYAFGTHSDLRVGISIGFACAPDDGSDRLNLKRLADVELYKAKEAGKVRSSPTVAPRWASSGAAAPTHGAVDRDTALRQDRDTALRQDRDIALRQDRDIAMRQDRDIAMRQDRDTTERRTQTGLRAERNVVM